jgi:hypothetical protein
MVASWLADRADAADEQVATGGRSDTA